MTLELVFMAAAALMNNTNQTRMLECINNSIRQELETNSKSISIDLTQALRACESNLHARISEDDLALNEFKIYRHKKYIIAQKIIDRQIGYFREIRIVLHEDQPVEGFIFFKGI